MKRSPPPEKQSQNLKQSVLPESIKSHLADLLRPLSESRSNISALSDQLSSALKKVAATQATLAGSQDPNIQRKSIDEVVARLSDGVLLEAVKKFGDQLDQSCARIEESFPEILKSLAQAVGISVSGAFPDVLLDSLVALSFDKKKHVILVEEERFPVTDVIQALERSLVLLNEVQLGQFLASSFLAELRGAYTEVCRSQGMEDGERLPIGDVLMAMAFRRQKESFKRDPSDRNYQGYGRIAFRRDLNRLLRGNELPAIDNKKVQLEPGSFSKEGIFMYVPSLGRCAFASRLRFA